MKKRMLQVLAGILTCVMLFANVVTVNAADEVVSYAIGNSESEIAPCYESVDSHAFYFDISDAGEAEVSVMYSAGTSNFSQAKVTVKIQKRVLGLFWTTVDIGETDNLWVDYSSDSSGIFSFSTGLGDEGTYRAVITLEVTTTSGTTDVIEDTIQATYG